MTSAPVMLKTMTRCVQSLTDIPPSELAANYASKNDEKDKQSHLWTTMNNTDLACGMANSLI